MKTLIRSFLQLGFNTLFTRYDTAWLDLGGELSAACADLIASDLAVKHPQLTNDVPLADRLARVLEIDAAVQAALLYRIEHALFCREPEHEALPYFAHFMRVRTAMEIYYSTEIGPRFRIMHGAGTVIGPRNKIGSDFTIYQGVTLGQRRQFSGRETMIIGDRCSVFAGAKVLGALRVGDDVKIAANAVMLSDAESGGTYAGSPAVKVTK